MRKSILFLLTACWLISCRQTNRQAKIAADSVSVTPATASAADCSAGQELVYSNDVFSTYTEGRIQGKGVASFQFKVNDRLNIYNEDDSEFGFIVLNEDLTFFTLQMPKKLVARKVIPEHDFATFDFDAEEENTHKEYLFIYANGERRKVKKAEISYTYLSWEEYIKTRPITLISCNPLKNAPKGMIFEVTTLEGERINIRSSQECAAEDTEFKVVEGWVKWRKGDTLMVDLTTCN